MTCGACESKGLDGHFSNLYEAVNLVPQEHQFHTRSPTVNTFPSGESLTYSCSVFLLRRFPIVPQTFPPFPWQLNRLWCGACQRLLERANRVCLLFPPLSIHLFGSSKGSSRLGRHNFSLRKTACLSPGGGVCSRAP